MPSLADSVLRTTRLVLRPLRPDDAVELFRIYREPQVARYLSFPPWTALEQAQARIARDLDGMQSGMHLRLGLERQDDGRLIGDCTLFNINAPCRRAEIGYVLAQETWGNGYMDEALRALVDFGFSKLDLNRIEADIDPRNTGSARSLERLGFTKEGHLRERWIVGGEVSDTGLYGLLAKDWQAAAARLH